MFATIRLLAVTTAMALLPGLTLAAASLEPEPIRPAGTLTVPLPSAGKPELVRLAQVDDTTYRIGQLEERIRVLNGQLEEMNFMMLQMQEQMRQMQQDNEFRFQELEGGGNRSQATPGSRSDENQVTVNEGGQQQDNTGTLGTITFDDNGNVVAGLSNVPYKASSGYLMLPAGTYDLNVATPDGSLRLIDPLPVTQSRVAAHNPVRVPVPERTAGTVAACCP